jgi:hypothetical protein
MIFFFRKGIPSAQVLKHVFSLSVNLVVMLEAVEVLGIVRLVSWLKDVHLDIEKQPNLLLISSRPHMIYVLSFLVQQLKEPVLVPDNPTFSGLLNDGIVNDAH